MPPAPPTGDAAPLPILFTHFGDQWMRGSETLLLDLIRHLDPARFSPVVWCNGHEMAEACRASGFPTHRTDFAYYLDAGCLRFSPGGYLAQIREGRALARQYGARVLHANSAAPTQWLLPVARSLRLPLLSHLHIGYLRRSRYALLLHQADRIVGVSRQALDGPLADGVPPARTRVIYNGIDFARLEAPPDIDLRAALGIAPGTIAIGAAGSLIHRKGHDLLIRALSRLGGERPPQLLLAGDGPERETLTRLAAELGVSSRVHFLGFQSAITEFYQACDIIALASRADAFGLVLAEAGFCRLPVVATAVGGIPEVIADEQTGLLVPPGDVAALTAALARLAADPALRTRLGQAGRERAEARFSVQRMAAEFGDTYDGLAALPPAQLGWSSLFSRGKPYARLLRGGRD